MKSFGFCAALLAPAFSGLVHSFPTAENFAKLAQRNGIAADAASDITPEQLHESLLKIKNKRLLFDPLTDPIDGAFWVT